VEEVLYTGPEVPQEERTIARNITLARWKDGLTIAKVFIFQV
jgi:hypothetical protein